ncbi:hypothetical protein [Hugenholtzia roseola]|uniref:hypothetical protein n=1 Tax=Hugenholtzia roseola TaxID=1002 RepID=UPI00042A450F|nr:hypothetical protein [Hugenholtzia roseola]
MTQLSSLPLLYLFFADSFWSATTVVDGEVNFLEIEGRTLFPLSFLAQGTVIEARFPHQIEDFEKGSSVFYDDFFINIAKKVSFQVLSRQFPYAHLLKTDLAQIKQQYLQKYGQIDQIPIQILSHVSLDKFPQDFFNFLTENNFDQANREPQIALRYLPKGASYQPYAVLEALEKKEKEAIFLHYFTPHSYEKIPLQNSLTTIESLTTEMLEHLQRLNAQTPIAQLYLVGDNLKKQPYLYESLNQNLESDKFSFLNTREMISLQVSNLAAEAATQQAFIPSPFEGGNETENHTKEEIEKTSFSFSENRAFFSLDWEKMASQIVQFENKILQKSYQKALQTHNWLHQEVLPYLKTQEFEILENYDFVKYYISEHYYANSTLSDSEYQELQSHLQQWEIETADVEAALQSLNIKFPNSHKKSTADESKNKSLSPASDANNLDKNSEDEKVGTKKTSKSLIWIVLSGVIFLAIALGGFWIWKKYQPTENTEILQNQTSDQQITQNTSEEDIVWEQSLVGTYQGKAYNRLTNELSFVRLNILKVESANNGKMNCTFTIENSTPQKGEISISDRTISFLLEPANRYELGVYQVSEATGRISLKSLAHAESILEKLK